MSNKLILCQGCIHREVCGNEGVDDPALTFCDDYLPINGWISVEDRMPEFLQNVIVCTDINSVTLAWINGTEWCFADQGNGKIERYGFEAVTHWQPLPESLNCGAKTDGGEQE